MRRPTFLLPLVLGALTAFAPLSIDMYLPSLPTITRQLHTTDAATQLTLAAFFAGMGLGQLVFGPLADRLGRKTPLYAGLGLYVLASLACALAPDVRVLIAMRFVQALGGAAGGVIARAVVRDLFHGIEAARLLSALMLVMGAAPILAPVLGGWVLALAGWRAIFAVLAALGLAGVFFAHLALDETVAPDPSAIDLRVLAQRFGAVLGHREFLAAALANGAAYGGMFAYIAGSPFVFIRLHHFSPGAYSAVFATNAAGIIGASQLNRRLLSRWPPATLLVRATTVMLVASAALVAVGTTGVGGARALWACLFVFVTSIGFIGPNATALAMEHQRPRAGTASAALGALQFACAAAAASSVGALHDGTARAMALVVGACGAAAFALGLVVHRVARPAAA